VREAIYKGATRPAMVMGVPLLPFLLVFCGSVLLGAWCGVLLTKWVPITLAAVGPATLLWLRLISARDDQRLHQVLLKTKLRSRLRNMRLWKSRSYGPLVLRGARDAYVR
jgi:type IV secretion system protein VirB3